MAPGSSEKRGGLTLEKLASYDDVITDALVDKIYYWTAIRKNRGGRFSASRGLHEEDIADIIRRHVICEKDPVEAVQGLLRLPGLRKYMASLKDEKDQEHFKRHLRRYVNIYLPDCAFEVTTTNRYTIIDHEASITARRDINPREEIKYLTGVQVAMTEEQEAALELARKDFSLVISSRKKTRSLFLGPARFANHDCDANARLSTKGYDGMQIVAVKPIAEGEEITVSYGEDYFGENNEECLCHTCEDRLQNGWAPMRRIEDSEDEDENGNEEGEGSEQAQEKLAGEAASDEEDASTRKRRHDSTASRDSTPASKRAKTSTKTSPAKRHASDLLREATLKKAHSTSSLRQELPVSSIEDPATDLPTFSRSIRTQQRDGLLTMHMDETSSSRESTPQSFLAARSPHSTPSTDATSIDEDVSPTIKVDPEVLHEVPTLGVATVSDETTTITVTTTISAAETSTTITTTPWDDSPSSPLSSLSSDLDSTPPTPITHLPPPPPPPRTTRSSSRFTHSPPNAPIPLATTHLDGYEPNPRTPGDYTRSPSILSAKYSKWVECQTCDAAFVQQDGYLTRKECMRCERHSKLYGFTWPKTERWGKGDREVRVLDHRTVHRFVGPGEGRGGRGRKSVSADSRSYGNERQISSSHITSHH
ncbi:hypothetical protein P153DRAFT_433836 [Dothidotthia symphoricarpi CBS 119687]|uniref:Histone-lysine N-methyltransferase SET9 n=1 Tax=Dothidotthia symphoricarpi CBS 119687 TaxID=1392245 RepID=A0A6A6A5I2_9PLEO|nr:uncharacterized protein P153DRAFT_433836 [Dothidotthia symphoricarpi CBS 119687]KAF2126028.1 hypothetical protein P153DRAFT_433836 [Dothidotthia symphoricarpi CBS 119687]